MKLEILKEITKWDTQHKQPNHTYFVEGRKCLAYIKEGTDKVIEFKNPMTFTKSYRKFIDLTGKL